MTMETVFKISDLIQCLEDIKAEHGDLVVTHKGQTGGVVDVSENPFKVELLKQPERRDRLRYYWRGYMAQELKGRKVLDI